MEVDRNGLEVLSREDCLRLLATAVWGRVAVSSRALPTIVPVNFHFDGRQIPDEIAAAQHPPLARWASASDDRLVAISTDVVSARRVLPGHVRAGEALDGST